MTGLIGKLNLKHFLALTTGAIFMLALACSSQPAPAPAPEPGLDPNQLSQLVQDAVAKAVPEQPDVPAPVSADEIQRMVEVGIAAAVPEGASPEDIKSMVEQAVTASTQPGASKEEIEGLIAKAVADASMSEQPTLSSSEVQKIVSDAIRTIPTAAPLPAKEIIVEIKPEPKGEFTVAWTRLDPLVQLYSLDNNSSVGGMGVDFQVYEGLYRTQLTEPGVIPSQELYVPEVAESWRVAQDLSKITFAIRKGIQWHNGWGELTAEDVVWTYNNSFEEGSINNAAESVPPGHKAGWDLKDRYTAVQNVREGEFSPVWGVWQIGMGHLDGTYGMVCKHCHDELGEEDFLVTPIGSGAYKANRWVGHDELELEAIPDHWQETANVKTVRAFEMPEAATKEAALLTGEVDFAQIAAKRLPDIIPASGGTALPMGMPWPQTIYMSGNYWSKWCPDCPEGEQDLMAMPRVGFKPDAEHPWIGDPFAPGCDYDNISSLQVPPSKPVCSEMENARLVRWAMSMAVDRQAILDNLLGGYGVVSYTHLQSQFPPGDPFHKNDWIVPFDPELAREYLAKAGYPNGFALTFWSNDDLANLWDPEVSAAIAEMWRNNLGLDVTLDRSAYASRRPEAVRKEMDVPWMQGWGLPPGSSKAISMCANPGIVSGIELPEPVCDVGFLPDIEPDLDKRLEANVQFNNYLSYWQLMPSFVTIPGYWVYNPTIAEWKPYWGPLFSHPVSVVLAE
jgi:ABC-type transport system substrate-binding protein